MRHLTPKELAGCVMLKELSEVPANRHPDVEAAAEWIDDAAESHERTIGYYPAPEAGCPGCPWGAHREHCSLHGLTAGEDDPPLLRTATPAPERCPWRLGWTVVMHSADRGGVGT